MADIRIKDLTTTASSTASGDFFVIDGTTGTRKVNAFSPTFGGNVVVTGTLTSQSTLSTAAGVIAQNADITGGYMILRGYSDQNGGLIFLGQSSNNNYIQSNATTIGVSIAGTGVTQTVAAGFRVLSTTSSTTTSSGALVVGNGTSGGLGVGGNITLGGGVNIAGAASDPLPAGTSGIWTLSGSGLRINSAGVTFASLTGTTLGTATLTVNGTTASTSTSSGALVVSGGVGVGGAIFAGGNIQCNAVYASNNTTLYLRPQGATVSSGEAQLTTTGNLTLAGNLSVTSTSAQIILGQASGSQLTYLIRPAQAGGAIQMVQDSATANRWLSLGISDNVGVYSELMRVAGATGNILITSTVPSTTTSSGALVVSGGVGVAGKVTSTALGLANTSQSAAAWGDVGVQLSVAGAVLTDTSSSGTVGRIVTNSIAASALAASSTTTYTAAASLFIAGAPTANTNVTITNAYALYTAGGRINFQGLPTSSAGLQAGTLWNDGGTLKVA